MLWWLRRSQLPIVALALQTRLRPAARVVPLRMFQYSGFVSSLPTGMSCTFCGPVVLIFTRFAEAQHSHLLRWCEVLALIKIMFCASDVSLPRLHMFCAQSGAGRPMIKKGQLQRHAVFDAFPTPVSHVAVSSSRSAAFASPSCIASWGRPALTLRLSKSSFESS